MSNNSKIINADGTTGEPLEKIWGKQRQKNLYKPSTTKCIQMNTLASNLSLPLDEKRGKVLVSDLDNPIYSIGNEVPPGHPDPASIPDNPISVSMWTYYKQETEDSEDRNAPIGMLMGRVAPTSLGGQWEWLVQCAHTAFRFIIYADPNKNGLGWNIDNRITKGQGNIFGAFTPTDVWIHSVATYDGSKHPDGINLYTNGAVTPSQGLIINDNYEGANFVNCQTGIGNTHGRDTDPSFGLEDFFCHAAVFNKALTLQEVEELYNGGRVMDLTKHSAYENVIGWWKLGDGDSTGQDGVINHAPIANAPNATMIGNAKIAPTRYLKSEYILEE